MGMETYFSFHFVCVCSLLCITTNKQNGLVYYKYTFIDKQIDRKRKMWKRGGWISDCFVYGALFFFFLFGIGIFRRTRLLSIGLNLYVTYVTFSYVVNDFGIYFIFLSTSYLFFVFFFVSDCSFSLNYWYIIIANGRPPLIQRNVYVM